MYTVIGLGNPGGRYFYTRHNIAWLFFHWLEKEGVLSDLWSANRYLDALYQRHFIDGKEILFVKPQTFMNRSGLVVSQIQKLFGDAFDPDRMVVIHDELDLPFGEVRTVFGRGAAGHHGVESIIHHLGTPAFWRIRIGISSLVETEDGRKVLSKPNVLAPFSREELEELEDSIFPKVREALEEVIGVSLS